MKILFIGTGGIGGRHAASVRALRPMAELIAVRSEHNETTRKLKMTLVPTLKSGLALNPTAAIIALPPALHAETASPVLVNGVAVYVEKPIATNCSDLKDIVADAEHKGVVTMTGCNLRFLPAFRKISDIISKGQLGRITCASLSVGQWLPDWRKGRDYRETYSASAKMGGGVIRDLIHEIDLARFWFGEFTAVTAVAGNTGTLEIDCEDHADIVLSSDQLDVSVHLDYLDRKGHRIGRIIGDAGTLTYDAVLGYLDSYKVKGRVQERIAGPEAFDIPGSAHASMAHFLDSLDTNTPTDQPLSQGLLSLELVEKAQKSAGLAK